MPWKKPDDCEAVLVTIFKILVHQNNLTKEGNIKKNTGVHWIYLLLLTFTE